MDRRTGGSIVLDRGMRKRAIVFFFFFEKKGERRVSWRDWRDWGPRKGREGKGWMDGGLDWGSPLF
jgi:hypothetical protein